MEPIRVAPEAESERSKSMSITRAEIAELVEAAEALKRTDEPVIHLARAYLALLDENEALAKALEPFAEAYAEFKEEWDRDNDWEINPELDLTLDVQGKHWKQANAALAEYAKRKHSG